MDSSTAAAIAAVAIAVLAFVVAFAQVLQQYFATASLLRLCDSVVYGPLPGRGRRVWQAGQFRFRIIYTLPQLRLERGLWDEDDNDDVKLYEYPYIEEWSDRKFSPPSLFGRMKVTSPYIDIETGFDAGHSSLVSRDQRIINKLWVLRANSYAVVAGRAYSARERVHIIDLDGEWQQAAQMEGFEPDDRRDQRSLQRYTPVDYSDSETTHSKSESRRAKNKRSENTQSRTSVFVERTSDESSGYDGRDDERSSHQASRLDESLAHGDESILSEGTGIAPDSGSESNENRRHKTDSTQAGDFVSMVYQGPSDTSKENFELAIVKRPETSMSSANKPGKFPEKREQGESLPITSLSKAITAPPAQATDREKVSSEGHDRNNSSHTLDEDMGTEGPELTRDAQREEPPQRRRRDWKRTHVPPNQEYNQPYDYRDRISPSGGDYCIWLSQIDIMHGYWATPWQSALSAEMISGALSAILEALSARLDKRNLQYIPRYGEVEEVLEWASGGRSTWPMYAMNARGGVIVQENKTKFRFQGFASKIAAVKLLHNYTWQVERYTEPTQADEKLAELMMLDSWLSICGREPEILNGASDLRHNMPLLIGFMFDEFAARFENLDRTANEGGLQRIQSVARSLLATLDDERLSAAEQNFTIVAMLRTAKVGSCIANGPNTWHIRNILNTDTRVWLV
ncbi:MAG: hypothetical protein Q9204_002866 [Flavoplaca sp. TL-2023a]